MTCNVQSLGGGRSRDETREYATSMELLLGKCISKCDLETSCVCKRFHEVLDSEYDLKGYHNISDHVHK